MQEPIAVVGTACRLTGSSTSPSKLWDLLERPIDVGRDFPAERLNFANFYSKTGEMHGRTDVNGRSYLLAEDVRLFDAAFFRINPHEAAGIDPQHRIVLEVVYEAFEAAGWPLDRVQGSETSVHVGVMTDDYYAIQVRDPDAMGSHAATGLSRSILSNRVSYTFDLRGPSMTLDTACSSSLVALHLAVQGLRRGEASQAIVAGTNLLLDPHWFITESSLHMLSPDALSRMWDKDASGYARGEGIAAVVLKPLSKAIQDGDHVECLIRETGVNSDGRTNGITMPSSESQAALMRQTYLNAGLDPLVDRCQYFECHGTGTQAGDPVEARAIRDCFFPENIPLNKADGNIPLYCGSIKTVVGHTEGCAGLAGLIKASLAIQHKTIPPNMHLNEINLSVQPFYTNLKIPTSSVPWPDTSGRPLRASINSFGFGGTNAHAIIESFEPSASDTMVFRDTTAFPAMAESIGPFVFSARTRKSLAKSLEQNLEFIQSNPTLDLDAFAHLLHSKRTIFSLRIVLPGGPDRQTLMDNLDRQILSATNADLPFGVKASTEPDAAKPPRLLGVFTGQGAQAANMARELLIHSSTFQDSIRACEDALRSLPEGPTWSLREELLAPTQDSRVSEAWLSQPACAAIQIGLVDLLRVSGVQFSTIVGHSSGEIGAAYAAGLLRVRDAMGIAYYRGIVAPLAKGPKDEAGGMIAVSMSFEDANNLCSKPQFAGRISPAASNAPGSVTFSGDIDAVEDIKIYLEEKNIQFRQLRVDTAYHSHHMKRCRETYLRHLEILDIQVQKPNNTDLVWMSSLRPNTNVLQWSEINQLRDIYWVDNMVQPVLFSQALEYAIKGSPVAYAAVIEIGPHPALKGPVSQILQPLVPSPLPYAGCLDRGKGAIETFSSLLGTIWSHLGPKAVNFTGWRRAFDRFDAPSMLKNLPSYPWEHDTILWNESRLSRKYRLEGPAPHNLLGRLRDDSQYEKTWRNFLYRSELPWLEGHTFEGQVLFPGAGYISLAIEAAKLFVQGRPIKTLEIQDMKILRALVIAEDQGVELLFTLRSKALPATVQDGSELESEFVAYSSPDAHTLEKSCEGRLVIQLGQPGMDDLPPTRISKSELSSLNPERFHQGVSEIGLVYNGPFRALKSINRSWGHAKAVASWSKDELDADCTIHPALLDVAFQAGLATFISTAERAMGTSYLPVEMRRAIINPNCIGIDHTGSTSIEIEARMAKSDNRAVEVDINLCDKLNDLGICGVQIEGLVLKAVGEPTEDRDLFVKTVWNSECAYGLAAPAPASIDKQEAANRIEIYERTTLFYMRTLFETIRPDEWAAAKWYHQSLSRYIKSTLDTVRDGEHPLLQEEWLNDDHKKISDFARQYPGDVDLKMLKVVGENLPSAVRKESQMIEHMLQDNLLSRLYSESKSLEICNAYVADLMHQVSHKYAKAKILEIGAGTGGTTLQILEVIGTEYSSYTCTDISTSFFGSLRNRIPEAHASKVDFKAFNVEEAPESQGFVEATYDVIIAANVLHATKNISETMKNARALLRPGGFLIAVEVTGSMLRETGLMGGLEGWWLSGKPMGPGYQINQWDSILHENGFSGVDCFLHDHPDASIHSCSVFTSQAVDERIDILRDPLDSMEWIPKSPVLIIGGKTLPVSKLVRKLSNMLKQWSPEITTSTSIDEVDLSRVTPETFVLCLSELDKPLFVETPTTKQIENLQELLSAAYNTLWITSGRLHEDPYSNIMVGIGRALSFELPHTRTKYLDFDERSSWDAEVILNELLRTAFSASDEGSEQLWEPEVVMKDGHMLIPRVIQEVKANDRFNAKRRRVTKIVNDDDTIELIFEGKSPHPILISSERTSEIATDHTEIRVQLSVALHTAPESPCYLCVGIGAAREQLLALSKADVSTLVVPTESIYQPTELLDAHILARVASALLVSQMLDNIPATGTTLIYGAEENIESAISSVADGMGIKIKFVHITKDTKDRPDCIFIHPRSSAAVFKSALPEDSSALVKLSEDGMDKILPWLPRHCIIRSIDPGFLTRLPPAKIALAISSALQAPISSSFAPTLISIDQATQQLQAGRARLSAVVKWTREQQMNAMVRPLQTHHCFNASKTYFLVGMTGELGQSLTRFMLQCGAPHIVLASRNPTEDPEWVKELRKTGAVIRLVKMDVTNRSAVRETVKEIRSTMPEIGGVVNAALVFEAGIFVNFSADDVMRQLRPKVDGTVYLDQVFKDDNLEFFMSFGSLATVCGNPGQAMYHAGNMFMASLIQQRRRRGQAGSILNFGLLVDAGYVARMDRADGTDIEGTLRSLLLTPLSEAEFHHVVLQGIISGRPDTPSGEVIMGMEPYIDHEKATARPPWVDKAVFSHMIRQPAANSDDLVTGAASSTTTLQGLRSDLDKADNLVETTQAVEELFCKKIEVIIKVPRTAIDLQAPLADLGLDSLNGIEIRQWLLKDLQVNIPLLKILGRESMSKLCSGVAQEFMQIRSKREETDVVQQAATDIPSGDEETDAIEDSKTLELSASSSVSTSPKILASPDSGFYTPASSVELTSQATKFSEESSEKDNCPNKMELSAPALGLRLPTPQRFEPAHSVQRSERLSLQQTGIHFLQTFLEDNTTFNVTAQYSVKGALNIDRLGRAFEKTLALHDAYQTRFVKDTGRPSTKQHLIRGLDLNRLVIAPRTAETPEEFVETAFDLVADTEYRLEVGETFRAVVISHDTDLHTLIFGFHLLASDAFSFSIFLKDLNNFYQLKQSVVDPGSYLDFSSNQIDDLHNGRFDDSIAYWKKQLHQSPAVLPLLPVAYVRERQPQRSHSNHICQRKLGGTATQAIRKASQACGATLMQFYLSVMQVLLARLAEVDDVCIGVTDSGRTERFANTIGHMANILPMRFKIDLTKSFEELVKNTASTALGAFDNAQVPFDVVLERLGIERSTTYTPLFQVAFNYRIGDILHGKLGNCEMTMVKYTDVKTPYDLTINVTQGANSSHSIECITNAGLFSESATKFLLDTFVGLLDTLTVDQTIDVKDCKLFSDEQMQQAMDFGQGPLIEHSWPNTIIDRFAQIASEFPDSVAIKDSDDSMTYDQLSSRVKIIANFLRLAGARADSHVGVFCHPSIDLYATMMAVLALGAIYVPLDVKLPSMRLHSMAEVCKLDLLVFHTSTADIVDEVAPGCDKLNLTDLNNDGKIDSLTNSDVPGGFLLFTSGSTGTPKGIRLTQSGIMNYAASKSAELGLGRVKVLQQSSTGFDMAVAQVFNAFANAGTLVVAPSESRGDPTAISKLMLDESIDFTLGTPSEYLMLTTYASETLRKCKTWRYVCSGGEAVTDQLVMSLRRLELPNLTLMDCYGPTEISCASTFQKTVIAESSSASGSIGRVIPNTSIYILDPSGNALPIGIPGEICIGGIGVAEGYLDSEQDATKFVLNPFATSEHLAKGWKKMYKSGDKGLLQEDGSLVFLGRSDGADTLVKLRGLRIDLKEVASAIQMADQAIADACVTVRGDPQYLVSHVVFAPGMQLDQPALNAVISNLPLPRYMIPSLIIPLKRLPTTPNGKKDRKAIQALVLPAKTDEPQPARINVPEGELRAIWLDVLGESAKGIVIGPDSDFFMVGGSSFLLVRLQNALKEKIGVVLSLHEMYQATTLKGMAKRMHQERGQLAEDLIDWDAETVIPADLRHSAPLTPEPRKVGRQVLLTGSTSFLGSEILLQLIANGEVETIHCIAVPEDELYKVPAQGDSKVIIYLGTLLNGSLGLSDAETSFLQSNVDEIIHAAVQGHCMNNYTSVKQALFHSTQTLARLALPRRIPFHLVSAPRVVLLSGEVEGKPISMAAHPPPQDGTQGVTASKWASEVFLEKISLSTGLPVVIHRHCALVGERAPADDVMNSVVRYSILSRKVPMIKDGKGFFDFKDVIAVAAAIANQREPMASAKVEYRHQSGDVRVPFDKVAQRLEDVYGGAFEVVDPAEWLEAALENGMGEMLMLHLQANLVQPLIFPYLGVD